MPPAHATRHALARLAHRAAAVAHPARVASAFGVVANAWFVILWTRAVPQEPAHAAFQQRSLLLQLVAGAATAVGLFVLGSILNDSIDARRDAALRPAGDRSRPPPPPLPASLSLVIACLALAFLGAAHFGLRSVVLTGVVCIAVLAFDAAAKFIPAVGPLVLGLIYAAGMLVPNPDLAFLWPCWVVLTHMLLVAATAHHLSGRAPAISRRAVLFAIGGWALWTVALALLQWSRLGHGAGLWPRWASPAAGAAVLAAAALGAGVITLNVRRLGPSLSAASPVARLGSWWICLYAVAWLWVEAGLTRALPVAALALAGLLAMTVLRDAWAYFLFPPSRGAWLDAHADAQTRSSR